MPLDVLRNVRGEPPHNPPVRGTRPTPAWSDESDPDAGEETPVHVPEEWAERFAIFDRNVHGFFSDKDFCEVAFVSSPEDAFQVRLPMPSGKPGVLVVTYPVRNLPEPENPFEDVWVMENYDTGVWREAEPDANGEAHVQM